MENNNPRATRRRRAFVVILITLLTFVYGVINQAQDQPSQITSPESSSLNNNEDNLAIDVLEKLEVKGRAPKTGYSRDQFGRGWANVEGCDMRNRILQRDLKEVVLEEDKCSVFSGVLDDLYTGATIQFKRGAGTSQAVQIDHMVALSDSWQKGAQGMSPEKREEFANDPLNLLAVDGPTNVKKGAGDAATWLPPNKDYRCRYVARQVAVKAKYTLWVTTAERDAIKRVLSACSTQQLPSVKH